MTDAPGGWELKRALDQIREDVRDGFAQSNQRLDKLVTAEAFAAEQRRVDERFHDLADDMATEKEERKVGDMNQQKTLDRLTANMRWIAAAIVLPIVLFVTSLLIAARTGAP